MAEYLLQMTNVTKIEDVAKNAAIGAVGGGLAGGGVGAFCGLGCDGAAPICVPVLAALGGGSPL